MVQRYDFAEDTGAICTCGEVYSEEGLYVLNEDYEKLKADRDYWYEKCLDAGLLDEERAADRKEQDELLDEWYRTEECPYVTC